MMPRKFTPKPCACGCNEMTKGGEFLPGHDVRLLGAIVRRVGGVAKLRVIVEIAINDVIVVNQIKNGD